MHLSTLIVLGLRRSGGNGPPSLTRNLKGYPMKASKNRLLKAVRYVPPMLFFAGILTGCSGGLQQFTVSDLQSASTVAAKAGDTTGKACWDALQSVAEAPTAPGKATAVEVGRVVKQKLQGPCAPLAAEFVGNLLHGAAGPLGALVP